MRTALQQDNRTQILRQAQHKLSGLTQIKREKNLRQSAPICVLYQGKAMPKYVIEREMPGAEQLTAAELQGAAQVFNQAIMEMGPEIQWLLSYVTADRFYCVYLAPDETAVREHVQYTGLPAQRISRVLAMIDPATAEE
jgi:hypothetical protein